MLGVSAELVKLLTRQYGDFLSSSGAPDKGKRRALTFGDLTVLSYVLEHRGLHHTYDEIAAGLRAGQRGSIVEQKMIEITPPPPGVMLVLQTRIDALQGELAEARALVEQHRGQTSLYGRLLAEKENLIRELYEEIGRLKAQKPSTK